MYIIRGPRIDISSTPNKTSCVYWLHEIGARPCEKVSYNYVKNNIKGLACYTTLINISSFIVTTKVSYIFTILEI